MIVSQLRVILYGKISWMKGISRSLTYVMAFSSTIRGWYLTILSTSQRFIFIFMIMITIGAMLTWANVCAECLVCLLCLVSTTKAWTLLNWRYLEWKGKQKNNCWLVNDDFLQEKYPKASAAIAGDRKYDVYMGIDVFGRGTYGGGNWTVSTSFTRWVNSVVENHILY